MIQKSQGTRLKIDDKHWTLTWDSGNPTVIQIWRIETDMLAEDVPRLAKALMDMHQAINETKPGP